MDRTTEGIGMKTYWRLTVCRCWIDRWIELQKGINEDILGLAGCEYWIDKWIELQNGSSKDIPSLTNCIDYLIDRCIDLQTWMKVNMRLTCWMGADSEQMDKIYSFNR